MLKTVQKQLPGAEADNMLKQLDLLQKQMAEYNVSLNDEQRRGLRTMAEGREGLPNW
jgi:dsDNA-binding SOS-regulon protein